MLNRFPVIRQYDSVDCALACLKMICKYYQIEEDFDENDYLHYISKDGISLASVVEIAQKANFDVACGKVFVDQLIQEVQLPCILFWNHNHFVVLYKIKRRYGKIFFCIADPAKGRSLFSLEDFARHWSDFSNEGKEQGIAIILVPLENKQISTRKKRTKKKSFLSIIFTYKRTIFCILSGIIIGGIIQLAFPFLTQIIVDRGIEKEDINFILLVLLGQMILITGNMFVDFFRRNLVLKLGFIFSKSLLTELVSKMLRLPVRFFDSKQIGDFIQRLQDHDKVERFVTVYFVDFIFGLISLLTLGIVLLIYSKFIFLLFLFGSAFYIMLTYIFINKKKGLNHELFAIKSKNQSKYYEILKGVTEIKLQNQEQKSKDEIAAIQSEIYRINLRMLRIDQYIDVGNIFVNELKNILITFVSAIFVIKGELTIGMMISVQYIIGALNVPIAQFLTYIGGYQDAKLSLNRMNCIFSINDEKEGKIKEMNLERGKISLENLNFKYVMSENFVLHNINIELPLGKTIAIVGSSGSGKTTFLKLILKLYEPTIGKILIGNTDVKDIQNEYWRNCCGAVLQDGYIFSGTIKSNIVMGSLFDEERFQQAVAISNVYTFVKSLPYKYDTRIGDNGVNLSQGQKQRILIARVIYKNPDILFFDEATNSLDASNEKEIIENLHTFLKNKTVFVVAHRLSTVKNADIILVMNNGSIIEEGTHSSLVNKRGFYYKLIKNQLELGK
jgi:ATP-binding cassette subfamily B protein